MPNAVADAWTAAYMCMGPHLMPYRGVLTSATLVLLIGLLLMRPHDLATYDDGESSALDAAACAMGFCFSLMLIFLAAYQHSAHM